jgi:hypothetical protein
MSGFGMQWNRNGQLTECGRWFNGGLVQSCAVPRSKIPFSARNASLLYPDGRFYRGEINAQFQRHGRGSMHAANGRAESEGEWRDDRLLTAAESRAAVSPAAASSSSSAGPAPASAASVAARSRPLPLPLLLSLPLPLPLPPTVPVSDPPSVPLPLPLLPPPLLLPLRRPLRRSTFRSAWCARTLGRSVSSAARTSACAWSAPSRCTRVRSAASPSARESASSFPRPVRHV